MKVIINCSKGLNNKEKDPKLEKMAKNIKSVFKELGIYERMPDYLEKHFIDTPYRIVKFWAEFTENFGIEPSDPTDFGEEVVNGIPIIRNIEYSSLCAHHFLPFSGLCHVAYLPGEKLLGLSKIPRIVKFIAKAPSIQEFLADNIAQYIFNYSKPEFVMVIMQGVHTCTSCRGIESKSTDMIFSAIRHSYGDNVKGWKEADSLKREVLDLLNLF